MLCTVATPRSTDADQALTAGNFGQAEQLFSAEVGKTPSAQAYAGLVRSQIRQHKVSEALASAQKGVSAFPSAESQTALGEALLRNGQVPEAATAFSKALAADHCLARAHFGAGQSFNLASMHASAQRELGLAHLLAPSDDEIRVAWMQTLPAVQRVPALREFLASAKALDADERRSLESKLALLEKGKTCHLAASVEKAKLELMPLLIDGVHVRDWGLNARINNRKTALLELDTSVSGLVLGRDLANKSGVENILGPQTDAAQPGYTGYADSIKIGNLEFKDCPVHVVEDSTLANGNSLISADIFKDYLITLNFANRSMNLDPLPKIPEVAGTTPGGPQDRYIAPEMKEWSRVYMANDRMLLPTGINDSGPFLFVLDTGTIFTTMSPEVARTVLNISSDVTAPIKGVSGKIVKIYDKEVGSANYDHSSVFDDKGEQVKIQRPYKTALYHFGPYQLVDNKGYSFDITPLSRSVGVEVSGLLGFPIFKDFGIAIDYRDGLVQFIFDKQHVYRTREGTYY